MNSFLSSQPILQDIAAAFTLSILLNVVLIGLVVFFASRANNLQRRLDEQPTEEVGEASAGESGLP
jgi:hypothetical protein